MCWQRHRDEALKKVRIVHEGATYQGKRLKSDPGAWILVEENGNEIKGYMVTYVDDVMIMSESALGANWIKAVKDHFDS